MNNNRLWVLEMADRLTCEITQQLSGIRLVRCPEMPDEGLSMDSVDGFIDGEYNMCLQFRAEPRMFIRMARNMIGCDPEDAEEVREYATEFFNILCGRFISEIYQYTHISARFRPTVYEAETCRDRAQSRCTLYFRSEEQELAQFSWDHETIKRLMKRSEA